jgi:hypothetical protein
MLSVSRPYSIALLAFASITSIPEVFLFFVGLVLPSAGHIIFWGTVLALIWGLYYGVHKKSMLSFWASLIMISALWVLLLSRTMMRIEFIIENGGTDRADGYGSPVAFLIGLLGEQLYFIPACVVVVIGWLQVFKEFGIKIRAYHWGQLL